MKCVQAEIIGHSPFAPNRECRKKRYFFSLAYFRAFFFQFFFFFFSLLILCYKKKIPSATAEFVLEAGEMAVLVPSTYDPDQNGKYFLRIWTENPLGLCVQLPEPVRRKKKKKKSQTKRDVTQAIIFIFPTGGNDCVFRMARNNRWRLHQICNLG